MRGDECLESVARCRCHDVFDQARPKQRHRLVILPRRAMREGEMAQSGAQAGCARFPTEMAQQHPRQPQGVAVAEAGQVPRLESV
jgi:hypothetical protein